MSEPSATDQEPAASPAGAPAQRSTAAEYVAIARVLTAHGVRGELKCAVLTDFPRRFAATRRVFLGPQHTPFVVQRARVQGRQVLLKLEGIDTRAEAERWRNALVEVPRAERVKLPRGHYHWDEVIGLEVYDEAGTRLGRVRDILQTGANDVYVVDTESGELLVPAIKDVVKRIDPAKGEMVVRLLEGMR